MKKRVFRIYNSSTMPTKQSHMVGWLPPLSAVRGSSCGSGAPLSSPRVLWAAALLSAAGGSSHGGGTFFSGHQGCSGQRLGKSKP